ncbi:MAG TPA: single-stranded-DNA-specific exonuclease RecJ [Chloroflexota bacterium]|nr:single-stranded-DNA-specific exonuclease RecJ [Chloroflexota bacterium]
MSVTDLAVSRAPTPEAGGAYQWYRYSRASAEELAALDCSTPLLAQLLVNRGITGFADARQFLTPDLSALRDPFALMGMDQAADRLLHSIQHEERIAIYGDYDVDGLTAASVLYAFLRGLNVDPVVFIPHRTRDGYGLNHRALDALIDAGAAVIVTVDCGITAIDEVARARSRGADIVVTDHHPALPDIPAATAVVNPNQPGCQYPFKYLSGAGVAYKLAQAIATRLGTAAAQQVVDALVDLAALGTMADVVPLVDENRVLVSTGLAAMRAGKSRPGIVHLARVAGVDLSAATAESLAFYLAPRLNAAGRLGDARQAFDLLHCERDEEAAELAQALDSLNLERQGQTDEYVQRALESLKSQPPQSVVLVAGDYPLGIAGIVAARLVDEFQLPAIVLGEVDGLLKGSARAPQPYNIAAGLHEAASLLGRFGGHARAAGLSMPAAHLDGLREVLEIHFEPLISPGDRRPPLVIDALVRPETISFETVAALEALDPCGEANPGPVLLWRGAEVMTHRVVGKGHLSMHLRGGGRVLPTITFRPKLPAPQIGERIDVAFEARREVWNDSPRLSLRLRDWRPTTID